MDGFEADIATYLTIDGNVFIAPQFDIKFEMNEGGSCPDFLALDFKHQEAVVVEVTAAADWKPLAARVTARETRWFSRVRHRLVAQNVIAPTWGVRFLGFVREEAKRKLDEQFKDAADVTFYNLEHAIVPWRYWDQRMQHGLPGNRASKSKAL